MTRAEIIAELESEISLLLRARDILSAPLADFMKVAPRKTKPKPAEKVRKQPEVVAAPVAAAVPPPPQEVAPEPQVRRVPPKRRVERRPAQGERAAKSGAALSGQVPSGPVAVSADEARKVQERAAPPVAVAPAVSELRPEATTERTLGSLIQAFERRAGLSGLEIP